MAETYIRGEFYAKEPPSYALLSGPYSGFFRTVLLGRVASAGAPSSLPWFIFAYVGNSLSLASDAFAVLSHLISMIIGLFSVRFSCIRWHKANTYGFSRADVLGAFGNSVFATALMFSIFVEAIKRFINPQKTEKALLVLAVGIAGLLFNVLNYPSMLLLNDFSRDYLLLP
uniref:Cation efflux protein transmembrane domain-containing protein n=1 Tax=Buteo japonicus TaxID=224669 RepID=A0A8C0AN11_9AVES